MEDTNWEDEYYYECSCGERFQEVLHAQCCKKCRNYSLGGRCLYVYNTRTEKLVWGRYPTEDERAQYLEDSRKKREELDAWLEEQERKDAEYEAELACAAEEARLDALYALQDKMDGWHLKA